jgi:hypothetical protein
MERTPLPARTRDRESGAANARVKSVALGARDTAVLKLRIGHAARLLRSSAPARCCHRKAPRPSLSPSSSSLIALLLPHQTGTAALDVLHTGAEHTLHLRSCAED